jgi:geranylgeranyl reductase family protein
MHDVAIVGAGPGGSAAAYYLARAGLDVIFVDKASFPRDKTCGDGLTPRALNILEDMGLLARLFQAGCHTTQFEITAPNGRSVAASFPQFNRQPGYTLIVPRLILDDMIRLAALAAGAAFESPLRVTDITTDQAGVTITGQGQGKAVKLKARLGIIATGASTPLLLRMGILKQTPPLALAARAYFEDIRGITDRLQLRFDGLPMPAYGWIFPLSKASANIGAGAFPAGWGRWRLPRTGTAKTAFDAFLQAPALRAMLTNARQVGPVKGYPIRIDFPNAPTYAERVLLVGEAAGLVNPLTGEGIDYALESGKLAAEHLIGMFTAGDLAQNILAEYDRLLRQRFQRLFTTCHWMRDLFSNRLLINSLIGAAIRRPDLKMILINIAFGDQTILENITVRRILRRLFNLAPPGD